MSGVAEGNEFDAPGLLAKSEALIKEKTFPELVKARLDQIDQSPAEEDAEARFLTARLESCINTLSQKAELAGFALGINHEIKCLTHLASMDFSQLLWQYWDMERYRKKGRLSAAEQEVMRALREEILRISQQPGLENFKTP